MQVDSWMHVLCSSVHAIQVRKFGSFKVDGERSLNWYWVYSTVKSLWFKDHTTGCSGSVNCIVNSNLDCFIFFNNIDYGLNWICGMRIIRFNKIKFERWMWHFVSLGPAYDFLKDQHTDQCISFFSEGMCSLYPTGWCNWSDDGTYSTELFGFSGKAGLIKC